ncbi:MAG: DUF1524 domain-containing protein [Prevotellaceae bacterium]|nr:DUF1524 domain-containing protein [Prevotellaceae bacterium]
MERQNEDVFTKKMLRRLFVLNYAPNSIWRYLVSVYFMHQTVNNRPLEEAHFCQLLDRIIAFVWAYTITNPGLFSLRTPLFEEMLNIVNDREVTFSNAQVTEEQYRTRVDTFTFSNNRPITKAMLAWWAFEQPGQQLLSLDTRFDTEHIYPRGRNEIEKSLGDPGNIEKLGNKALLEKGINIRASDYRFQDKVKYYRGFTTESGTVKPRTKIAELLTLSETNQDFTEADILQRDARIIDGFVAFLSKNNLLRR